jgi:hypothetical protein
VPPGCTEQAEQVATTGWVGFGLSPNGQMPDSDVVIGWVTDDGQTVFHDRFAAARAPPSVDEQQDWKLEAGEEENGFTVLEFSRKLITCDKLRQQELSGVSMPPLTPPLKIFPLIWSTPTRDQSVSTCWEVCPLPLQTLRTSSFSMLESLILLSRKTKQPIGVLLQKCLKNCTHRQDMSQSSDRW